MGSGLHGKVDEAVATMRSGSDEDVVLALLNLATEPPTAVLEFLVDRLVEHEPMARRIGTPGARTPDDRTVARVYELVHGADGKGLMDAGGGTYDGLVALLVAVLAAFDDRPPGDRIAAPS